MSTLDTSLVSRNSTLSDLVSLLREQHAAKLDVVVPAAGLRSQAGVWEIGGTGPAVLEPDGVTAGPGRFVPTGTCDAGMADKLGIPVGYLRRLREEHLGLYDANVNGWLELRWPLDGSCHPRTAVMASVAISQLRAAGRGRGMGRASAAVCGGGGVRMIR